MRNFAEFRSTFVQIAQKSLFVAAVLVSAGISANDGANCGWDCHPESCCDVAPQCPWAYNPPAQNRCGCNPCGGFLDNISGRVDFLWWRACSEGTELGYLDAFQYDRLGQSTILSTTREETRIKDLDFKFDPGFRLGLGYYCPSNCWDIALNWTHFHSKASASGASVIPEFGQAYYNALKATSTRDFELFIDNWSNIDGLYPEGVHERWTLDMDLVDLEFGQKFYVNRCFIVRPSIGVRFARIDQNIHVDAFLNQSDQGRIGSSTLSFRSKTRSTNDFRGAGPRIGLDIEIDLGCNFSIYGKGGAALVYGEFDRSSLEEAVTNASLLTLPTTYEVETAVYKGKGKEHRCTVPMTDITIGLKWDHCFECCNTYHPFSLGIAWEQNAFYNLNDFNYIRTSPYESGNVGAFAVDVGGVSTTSKLSRSGNLLTQGLTVSATIGF